MKSFNLYASIVVGLGFAIIGLLIWAVCIEIDDRGLSKMFKVQYATYPIICIACVVSILLTIVKRREFFCISVPIFIALPAAL